MALGKWMLAGAASLALTGAVNAAFLDVQASIQGYYHSSDGYTAFNSMGGIDPLNLDPDSGTYQFYYTWEMTAGGFTSPELGFGNGSFGVDFSQNNAVVGVQAELIPMWGDGWEKDNGQVTIGKTPVAKWDLNGDYGPPANNPDLQEIIWSIVGGLTATTDPRVVFGQAAPVFFGGMYVSVDTSAAGAVRGVIETLSVNPTGWSTNNGGLFVDSAGLQTGDLDVASFKVIPEPASLGLLVIGGLLALRRR